MPLLFLSHSGADSEAAKELKRRIEASPAAKKAGLRVWFDKDCLEAGRSWRQQLEAAIARADAFAVLVGSKGVVNWVEAEVDVALSRATASPAFLFIPIIARESEGSSALPAFAQRYQAVFDPLNDANELGKLVTAVTGGAWDHKPILTDEPFVGLRSMDESWANRFFGRKAEVRGLVEKFEKHRLVAIVADSGAGKSSLAQAGFVPAFRGGALADERSQQPDDKIWHVVVMRPGNDPVQGLKDGLTDAARLLGLDGTERKRLRDAVKLSDVAESAYALRCDLDRARTETLLIVDQFEELLIQTPETKRLPFVDFLCGLADGAFGFRVLLTLRTDYFNFDESLYELRRRLWSDRQDAVFRLRRMSDGALAETAREPLALVGFDDRDAIEALIQAIQHDVADREGDLALVQMALHSVWRRHKRRSEDLLQAYAEVQGVAGALAHEAEEVRNRLNISEQALLFPILARLIRRGELGGATRRIARLEEFDSEKRELIMHLSSEDGGRLLLVSDRAVEIAHDALITRWPWLRMEGQKFAADIGELARLMDKAKAWEKQGEQDRYKWLATGAELETFSALAACQRDWLSGTEVEFLDASNTAREAEEKRKAEAAAKLNRQVVFSRIFAASAAIALVIVCIVGWGLYGTYRDLERSELQSTRNLNNARKNLYAALVALAKAELKERPTSAAKLALAAWPRQGAASLPKTKGALYAVSQSLTGLYERVRAGSDGAVAAVAFNHDGKRFLTGSFDTVARMWDATTGKELRAFIGHDGPVGAVAFNPAGTLVLTASSDRTARLWDAATGKQLRGFDGHAGSIGAVVFSPDGTLVLTGSEDKSARLWDATTGRMLRMFTGHGKLVTSVAFSLDGARVLTGSADATARLWDAATGRELRAFKGHGDQVTSVAFSPDGARVLTGSDDDTARIWDGTTGNELRALKGRTHDVKSVAFSPDGARVLTGSSDRTARLWDVATGRELRVFSGHDQAVASVAYSPDGTRALTGSADRTARLWDIATGSELQSATGHQLAVYSVAFSPDGRRVLTGSRDRTARLWDAGTGRELAILKGHDDFVRSVAFSPDGTRVVTGSWDKTARLWDATTGTEIRVFDGHGDQVLSVAVAPDGARVLTGSSDKTARVWDTATGEQTLVFTGHKDAVTSVAFSRDGTRALTGSRDKTARLWELATGQVLHVFEGHTHSVEAVAFSPDGTRVSTGSRNTVRLFDIETGAEIRAIADHEEDIASVAFSPDGTRILTASLDNTARLWDAATGQQIHIFSGHAGPVFSSAFSANGTRVLTGSQDRTARLWDVSGVPPGSIFDIACTWLPDHGVVDLGKDYDLDLSGEPPICQKDANGGFTAPLPDPPSPRQRMIAHAPNSQPY